jgi:hypothetical protein
MGKYSLIRQLGLQVFTKPLSNDTMVVSADDLSELLESSNKVKRDRTLTIELITPNRPKTLSEKILEILDDPEIYDDEAFIAIRKLVEK